MSPASLPSSTQQHLQPLRLGIIGGGQLARMMAQKAKKMGLYVIVLDPVPDAPAGQVADAQVVGRWDDLESLRKLVSQCDVTTYDLEAINTPALKVLAQAGHVLYPRVELLEIIQDKLVQKQFLQAAGLPVVAGVSVEQPTHAAIRQHGFPVVQKARRDGYDGRGVVVLRSENDLSQMLTAPSVLEPMVAIDKELAVMVARSTTGEVRSFPVVEMVFDERANILDMLLAPARISKEITQQAQALAERAVQSLDGVGIFGVEMFLTQDGSLLINEIAPRPHNSGHYTMEACTTCQFEQHVRAVCGLPLGSTELVRHAATLNILGVRSVESPLHIHALRDILAVDGASVHLYGKATTRPFRKMGHITVTDTDSPRTQDKAHHVKRLLDRALERQH